MTDPTKSLLTSDKSLTFKFRSCPTPLLPQGEESRSTVISGEDSFFCAFTGYMTANFLKDNS